jgi:hypothetical protein
VWRPVTVEGERSAPLAGRVEKRVPRVVGPPGPAAGRAAGRRQPGDAQVVQQRGQQEADAKRLARVVSYPRRPSRLLLQGVRDDRPQPRRCQSRGAPQVILRFLRFCPSLCLTGSGVLYPLRQLSFCPECGSGYRIRVYPHGLVEHIARIFGWHVYRCLECGHYYRDRPSPYDHHR